MSYHSQYKNDLTMCVCLALFLLRIDLIHLDITNTLSILNIFLNFRFKFYNKPNIKITILNRIISFSFIWSINCWTILLLLFSFLAKSFYFCSHLCLKNKSDLFNKKITQWVTILRKKKNNLENLVTFFGFYLIVLFQMISMIRWILVKMSQIR